MEFVKEKRKWLNRHTTHFRKRGGSNRQALAAPQAEAIVETMTRATTDYQQMAQELSGVKNRLNGVESRLDSVESNLSEVKIDLAVLKNRASEMATRKDVEAALATVRSDVYRALWIQGLSLVTLIVALAVAVAGAAAF